MTRRTYASILRLAAMLLALQVVEGCGTNSDNERVPESKAEFTEPSPESEQPVDFKTFVFECDDGNSLVARLETRTDTLTLLFSQRRVQLPHLPSASGAKYGNEGLIFWTKGSEALMSEGAKTVRCTENRRKSILEDAKIRGIQFRGTGNEPGWVLEIGTDSILLVTNYGNDRYEFPRPQPEPGGSETETTYRSQEGDHEVVILLEEQECRDTMADETFDMTVTITLNGRTLSGCGTLLQ